MDVGSDAVELDCGFKHRLQQNGDAHDLLCCHCVSISRNATEPGDALWKSFGFSPCHRNTSYATWIDFAIRLYSTRESHGSFHRPSANSSPPSYPITQDRFVRRFHPSVPRERLHLYVVPSMVPPRPFARLSPSLLLPHPRKLSFELSSWARLDEFVCNQVRRFAAISTCDYVVLAHVWTHEEDLRRT